jgi:hypothetical protein
MSVAVSIRTKILDGLLTNSIQHLVALIEDKDLDAAKSEVLIPHERVQSTWGCHKNVGVRLLVLQNLGILLDGGSSVEHCGLDIGHVLAEASILVLDLVGQLTSVAHDQHRGLACDGLDLLKRSEHEDCGLSETRFGLAKDVGTEDCLRDAYLLDCRVNRADVR